MEEWKLRQLMYKMFATKLDIIEQPVARNLTTQQLIDGIVEQFNDSEHTFHPFKSYCVALVYAYNLAKKYGGSQIVYLSDPDLLPNDPCFVPYQDAKLVYNTFVGESWWHTSAMGSLIYKYWSMEYCEDIKYE